MDSNAKVGASDDRPLPLSVQSSPAPFVKPAIVGGGARAASGLKAPRLGLSIPSAVTPPPTAQTLRLETQPSIPPISQISRPGNRPTPPSLRLATPFASQGTHSDSLVPRALSLPPAGNSSGAHGDTSTHTKTDTFTMVDGKNSNPTSASSSGYSVSRLRGTPDPNSAISSINSEGLALADKDGQGSAMPDIGKLQLEQDDTRDVDELDDEGWRIASEGKKILDLGSLGEGAGGAVNRCKLVNGKIEFALKIITTDPNPDVKKQIVRELAFNKDCHSPHICKYYGAFVDESTGTISIAMEFCAGGSLHGVYKEIEKYGGRVGEKVLGKVAEGVLNGLTYLHGQKIIHRDIKPSNILLTREGQVRLCDFGVSGEFGTQGNANTFIGTSYYMAPERITGQSYTITSDVWSLGVTLLEVAQHRFPFPADGSEMAPRAGLIDLLTYIVRQPIPQLKDEPPDANGEGGITWSGQFKYFIECCLEKEQARRATPWRMIEHPWMLEMQSKKVNMANFLAQVWDWKK